MINLLVLMDANHARRITFANKSILGLTLFGQRMIDKFIRMSMIYSLFDNSLQIIRMSEKAILSSIFTLYNLSRYHFAFTNICHVTVQCK